VTTPMQHGPEERPTWRDHPAEPPGLAGGESRAYDRVNGTDWPVGDPWATDEPADWVPPGWPAPVPRGPRRPLRAALVAAAVAVGAALLGVPYGLLWAKLAPEPVLFKVNGGFYPQSGLYPVDSQPEQFMADDGWFMLLGVGFGVVAAIVVWLALRRWRGPLLLFALIVGAVAGGVLAWRLGHQLGLEEYQRLLAQAPEGTNLDLPADLQIAHDGTWFGVIPKISGVLLAEAFGAALAYTLLAGWSRHPTLRPVTAPAPDLAPWDTAEPVSSGSTAPQAGTSAPAPHGPDAADPPLARE